MPCSCGFSSNYPQCDGTHKVVSKVRKSIGDEISLTALPTHPDVASDPIKMFIFMRDWTEKIARGK